MKSRTAKALVFTLTLLLVCSGLLVADPVAASADTPIDNGTRNGNIAINNGWSDFKTFKGLDDTYHFYSFGNAPTDPAAKSQSVYFDSEWKIVTSASYTYYFTVKVLNVSGKWKVTSWKSNFPISFVFLKAGDGYTWYQYGSLALFGSGLSTPGSKSLSHFAFAYQRPQVSNLRINKIDADTGDSLAGAEFSVYRFMNPDADPTPENLTLIESGLTSDSSGQILLTDLAPGKYYVTETSAPSGYALDATGSKSVDVVAGLISDVTFENEALPQVGDIRITKLDADTEAPLSGAEFSIYQFIDADAAPATANLTLVESGLTSDSGGQVVKTGLPPGKYYVIETSAPSGYAIDATGNKSVHVVAGVTADVTFENEALPQVGGIRITKLDADTEAPLSGAVFSIYQFIDANAAPATANLTLIESGLTSDSSGRVVKTGLTPGKYYVIETSAPSGYAIDATGNKSVHVVAGLTSDVTFENEALPQYGSLMITKQDITNDAYLSGAVFRVYRYIDADGDPVAANLTFLNELTSNVTAANPTGSVGLTGLDPGKYFVEETVAPAGYLDDDTDKTAVVVAGESVTVAFRNSPIIDIPDEDPPGGDVNPKTGSNDLLLCIVSMLIVLIALGRFLIRKPARRQA